MRGRGFFVTGTDTGVGKTWVAARLAELWTRRGFRVAALKAAESGCVARHDGLFASDDQTLFDAAGAWQTERCRFRFEAAVAPGVAADDLGQSIDFDRIHAQVGRLLEQSQRVLIEGAGGWLVPMGEGRTIEDLAEALALPVIVVGRASLGTINHTALTIRAIDQTIAAVILSVRPDDDRVLAERNALEIAQQTDLDVHLLDGSPDDGAVLDHL
jgi:dethiobiotin synthetase